MAEIEHNIQGDEFAEIEVAEEFANGFYFRFMGNGTEIKIYLDAEQIEALAKQINEYGFGSSD